MYRHEGCGGELKKFRQTGLYICIQCKGQVNFGIPIPMVTGEKDFNLESAEVAPYVITEDDVSLHSLIANGGKVLVVGGNMNPNWARFTKHPQTVFWNGDQKDIRRHLKAEHNFPDNTKVVILSRFLSHTESGKVIEEARKKRVLIINTLNDGEITRKLEEILTVEKPVVTPVPPEPKPVVQAQPLPVNNAPAYNDLRKPKQGEIADAIETHYNPSLTNIENARIILSKLKEGGISSTEGSVNQAVYQFKKKHGVKSPRAIVTHGKTVIASPEKEIEVVPPKIEVHVPKASTKNEPSEDDLVKLIDDAIKAQQSAILGLELVRDQILAFRSKSDEFEMLKNKLEKLVRGEL